MCDTSYVWHWDFDGNNKKGVATYSGKPLKPDTEYYWKVMTWDEEGQSPFSEISSFMTT